MSPELVRFATARSGAPLARALLHLRCKLSESSPSWALLPSTLLMLALSFFGDDAAQPTGPGERPAAGGRHGDLRTDRRPGAEERRPKRRSNGFSRAIERRISDMEKLGVGQEGSHISEVNMLNSLKQSEWLD